jgi:hypothetical protein
VGHCFSSRARVLEIRDVDTSDEAQVRQRETLLEYHRQI